MRIIGALDTCSISKVEQTLIYFHVICDLRGELENKAKFPLCICVRLKNKIPYLKNQKPTALLSRLQAADLRFIFSSIRHSILKGILMLLQKA